MSLVNKDNELSLGGIIDAVQHFEDATSMSLFQYTKRSTINSRVYIERSLANEEILPPLMLNIMNLYTGLILTAMDMNRFVHGSKKVRDAMSVVATEGFDAMDTLPQEKLASFFLGSKDLASGTKKAICPSSMELDGFSNASGGGVVEPENRNPNLPSGRIIEVKFGPVGKDSSDSTFAVNLFLQLMPYYIPTEVASQFVGLNFTPSVKQRWMQARVGEISTIRDLILGQDLRKQRMKALKNDKTGALSDMLDRQSNALANSWMKLSFLTPERQNIANTILIFDKATFDRACSNSGLRFKDYNSRQKFFNKTFAMMLCVVDPMYSKIDMYYHGLPAVSSFTFEQMKRNAKTEAVDLLSVMKNYAQGMAPKF